jgi:hypothetical protein
MDINDVFKSSERDKILHMKSMAKSYIGMIFDYDIDDFSHYLVVSGGAFPDWFHGKDPKDIDVFVLHDDTAKNKLRSYLGGRGFVLKSIDYLKQTNPGATHVQEIWEGTSHPNGRKYQFIFTDYWSREELIKGFDYKHCMVSYDVGKNQIYTTRQIYDAIANKHLIVNNQNRVAEWRRTKFLDRGYTVPVREVVASTTMQELYEKHRDRLMKELKVNGQ